MSCVKAKVIDPFGAAVQKGGSPECRSAAWSLKMTISSIHIAVMKSDERYIHSPKTRVKTTLEFVSLTCASSASKSTPRNPANPLRLRSRRPMRKRSADWRRLPAFTTASLVPSHPPSSARSISRKPSPSCCLEARGRSCLMDSPGEATSTCFC